MGGEMTGRTCAEYDGGACTADMGTRCPNCGGQADRIGKGDVSACEQGGVGHDWV